MVDVPAFILASASPRRRALLAEAGYRFEVDASEVDEPEPGPGVVVDDYVAALAWKKARAVAVRRRSGLILGADTACAVDGVILNKPVDRDDARRMIGLQAGRDTRVVTGVCLYLAGADDWIGAVEASVVRCRAIGRDELEAYLDSGRWEGKAGAYGVQDDDPWIEVVEGSLSNVVGLPLGRIARLLAASNGLTKPGPIE